MFKRLKKSLVVLIAASLISTSANAVFPIVAGVIWLGQYLAANATVAVAVEASIYIHAGAYLAYELFYAEKGADGKPTGKPPMTIKLSPSAVRANPDPTKYDSATGSSRDPTPKSIISPSSQAANDPNDAGSGGGTYWKSSDMGQGQVIGGSASAVTLQALTVSYCVGGYASLCELKQCTSSVVGGLDRYTCAAYAKPGTMSCSPGADGKCMVGTVSSTKYIGTPPVVCPSGKYSQNGSACTDYAGQSTGCSAGYTFNTSTSTCNLTDATAVKKPANWPCEVLRTSTGLQVDKSNTNCDGVNLAGNSVSPSADTSVSFNADGSVSVSNPNGQTTFQLGTPNPDGSVPIIGATRSGNPASYTPGGTSTPSSCGGVGQPACSGTGGSTAGSSLCGGSGQPACSVTIAGFDGLGDPTASGKAALDTAANDRSNSLQNQTNRSSSLNILSDWVPKPQISTPCEPIVISFMRATFSWDFCKYLPLISQVMGYFFYIYAGLYIWKSFMNSNTSKGA